jgi:hypothetical protein
MRASITSPTKSPRRRVEHIKSNVGSSSFSSSPRKMVIAAPPLTASDTSDESHCKSAAEQDTDDIGMHPVVPQQRRLSLWGKMIIPREKRRHSIDGSMHKNATTSSSSPPRRLASPRRTAGRHRYTGRRRLSFLGSSKTPKETKTSTNNSSPNNTVEICNNSPVKHKRRWSFFGLVAADIDEPLEATDQSNAQLVQEDNNDFKLLSSIRRRLSLFNSNESENQDEVQQETKKVKESHPRRHSIDESMHSVFQTSRRGLFGSGKDSTEDNPKTDVQDVKREKESTNKRKTRRHSIDNSMHDASSPFRRRVSFFGSKIVYDERPDTKSKKKSKKRSSRRRNSIDGSQHAQGGKARRRLSFFGSKTSGHASESDYSKKERKRRKVKKTKKVKANGHRRHSIDGSMHR